MINHPKDRRHDETSRKDVWVSFDQGKSWSLAKIQRFKPWRWEVLLVAGLSLMIGGIGWVKNGAVAADAKLAAEDANHALVHTDEFAQAIRDAAVDGCQRQNKVRSQQHVIQDIMRAVLHDEIEDSRNLSGPVRIAFAQSLGVSLEEFDRLIRKDIRQQQKHRRELNEKLDLANCEAAYPQSKEEQ